jgi:aminopeptidase N
MRKKSFCNYILSTLFAVSSGFSAQELSCQAGKNAQALPIYYSAENLRSDTFNILKYTINLLVGDPSNPSIQGSANIRVAPKINNRTFVRFDLLKLTVDSVKENATHLTYTYNDTILKVNFSAAKNVTDTFVITVYYKGQPQGDASGWGGFYFDNTQGARYAYNLGVGFAAKPHNYGRVWFPCFDNFVERSRYEFNITCDTARRSYCNGQLVSDLINGSMRTRKWILNEEIPTYLACVAVGQYAQVNWTIGVTNGTKPITLVGHPGDTSAMKTGFVNLKNCIHGFENYYGPFVWNKFGYCLVPFSGGAMEHATNISYPRLATGSLGHEDLMSHELSHHWWGDQVTCETQEDMWINEGMATFSAYMFFEWQYGKSNYLSKVKNEHENLLHFLHKNEKGFRAISGVPHEYTYGDHVYKKGADVAHTLRGYLGDSAFFAGLKYVLTQRTFKSMNSLEFRDLMSTGSGQNLNSFFSNWVMSGGWSHFSIDSVSYFPVSGNDYNAYISLRQKLYGAPAFHTNVPLELSFFDASWNRVVRTVIMSGATGNFTVSVPYAAVYCALNYDSRIGDATSHEVKIIKNTGNVSYPLGKVFLQVQNKGADSSLVRVIHNYVPPDNFKENPIGNNLSNQHYWKVEGIFSPGFVTRGRFNYDGNKGLTGTNAYLDTLLAIVNGDSIALFYRRNAADDWRWLRNATKNKTGTRTGFIEVDTLQTGEYTFANLGDTASLGLSEVLALKQSVRIYPNPAKQICMVELANKNADDLILNVMNTEGRLVHSQPVTALINSIDISTYKKGTYFINLNRQKSLLFSGKLVVE